MKKSNVKIKLLTVLFLVFCFHYAFGAACGDVNGDGSIDIVDALVIAQHYVDLHPVDFDPSAADVDGNGNIDIVDALLIAQYYVDLIDELTGCPSTMTPEPTSVPIEPETVFAVNCGGSAYTASDGTQFAADTGFSGGSAYDNGSSVSGTSDPTLYSTERYGDSVYSAPVPNGDFLVTLYFAENYHTSSGSRIFNVIIEGNEAIGDLDIYTKVGAGTAYVTDNYVTVSDGEINIEFVTVTENALINAIKVDVISYSGDPVVKFTVSPSSAKPNSTVTVDASASIDYDGSITHYQVNWGDGYTTEGAVTSHSYSSDGNYTITVTITDNEGNTASSSETIRIADIISECPFNQSASPSGSNWVNGQLITFNSSGGWCWYQDERAIVDKENNKLIIGSVQNGQAHVVHWNLASGSGQKYTLDSALPYNDDHDTAAFIKTKDGGYAAMWSGHKNDNYSRYSYFNGSSWSSKKNYDWGSNAGDGITYSNMWYIGNTLYSYVRSTGTSPNYLYSNDNGRSWNFGGRLTSTPQVGYVAGYYKYWGNNVDRIDFLGTEAHPRDNNNSLYHGYVQNGRIYNSNGQVIDSDFTDRNASNITAYTQMFRAGSSVGGVSLDHAWNADLVRYDDGTIAVIWTARVVGSSSSDPDKRLMYARFSGNSWKLTYLSRAGTKLYDSEQDYTGLGALDPDNPEVIYISTPYDPRTDQGNFSGKKEIWKGVTCDNGATFHWVPVTANSSMDNLRPIVPKWDESHRALLWMRGTYSSAQSFDTAIVGLIEGL
ncbi:MAG: PKD domain-containing protein [Spirochaetales bacterium]|nr:PKD domain-containing protein [Spirochaetales bacterium]